MEDEGGVGAGGGDVDVPVTVWVEKADSWNRVLHFGFMVLGCADASVEKRRGRFKG